MVEFVLQYFDIYRCRSRPESGRKTNKGHKEKGLSMHNASGLTLA
ncbi:Uncharacterised protein [Shigella sonnei]|nr:Uncharacterised protein [Shigella sonnei]